MFATQHPKVLQRRQSPCQPIIALVVPRSSRLQLVRVVGHPSVTVALEAIRMLVHLHIVVVVHPLPHRMTDLHLVNIMIRDPCPLMIIAARIMAPLPLTKLPIARHLHSVPTIAAQQLTHVLSVSITLLPLRVSKKAVKIFQVYLIRPPKSG